MIKSVSVAVHCFDIVIIVFQDWMVSGPEQTVQ